MKLYTIERLSVPHAAPALPCAALPAALEPSAARAAEGALGMVLTVDIPQAHQVQLQAQTGLLGELGAAGGYGDTRFVGTSVLSNIKRMDVRGIPPRGKPV